MEKAYICSPLAGNEKRISITLLLMQSSFTTDVK